MSEPRYQLISFVLCPFVQRSVITLEEKGIPYGVEYIDLYDKPDWFLAISPFGKVPVLRVGDTTLFESAVINEYLDEVTPPSLHPAAPLRKAYNRAWIEVASTLVFDQHHLGTAPDEATYREKADAVRARLARLEEQLGDGPLFNGEAFSLVDAAAAPALQRIAWMEQLDPDLDLLSDTPKVKRWTEALLNRPSVQRSTVDDIQERFADYLLGGGSPSRDVEPSWLGRKIVQ